MADVLPVTGTFQQVTQQFTAARAYGDQLITSAIAAAEALVSTELPEMTYADQPAGNFEIKGDYVLGEPSVFTELANTIRPFVGSAPSIDLPSIGLPTLPLFTDTLDIFIPEQPGEFVGEPPEKYVSDFEITIPEAPGISLPAVPELELRPIPTMTPIQVIEFDAEVPTLDIEAPGTSFFYDEDTYSSRLHELVDDTLYDLIEGLSPSTAGLPTDVEEAIFARGRKRVDDETVSKKLETLNFFSSRGFVLPPGALNGALLELDKIAIDSINQLNYELIKLTSDLAQNTYQFAIKSGLERENSLLTYANNVAQRSFDAAKYVHESAILTFNARVTEFNTRVELYRIKLAAYKTQLEGEQIRLDGEFKLIEAALASAQVDQLRMETYKAQVSAQMAAVEIYNSQIKAVNALVEVERTKVMVYGETVKAYGMEISAYTSEIDAYRARVGGATAEAQVFATKADAYKTQIQGIATSVDAQVSVLQGNIEEGKFNLQKYLTDLEAYKANVGHVEVLGRLNVAGYEAKTQGLIAQGELAKSESSVQLAKSNYQAEVSTRDKELLIRQAEINMQKALEAKALVEKSIEAGGTLYAQLAAGALSTIHASASIGYNGSKSDAYDNTKNDIARSISLSGQLTDEWSG